MVKHQYRSRNEIIASILEVANGNGLLEYIEGECAFKTTPKGMLFLHTHNQMSEMIMTTNTATRRPVNEFLF